MRARHEVFGYLLVLSPLLACNSILGLERAELASTAAGHSGTTTADGGADGGTTNVSGGTGHLVSTRTTASGGGTVTANSRGGTAGTTTDTSTGGTDAGAGGDSLGGSASETGGVTGASGSAAAGCAGSTSNGGQSSNGAAGSCVAGAGAGGDCGSEPNPPYSCLGRWLVTCGPDGTTQSKDCGKEELCDAANAQCDRCVANSTSCADEQRKALCSPDGQTQTFTPCPAYCSGGACVECLTSGHCPDPGECLDPTCNAGHSCSQTASVKGTKCKLGSGEGVCDGEGHCGGCTPGARRCSTTGVPELCVASGTSGGQWVTQPPCRTSTTAVPYSCIDGLCEPPPSCRGMVANQCGASANQHCCASPTLPGASYTMGTNGTSPEVSVRERPAHLALVGAMRLDAFEVTVGRFRRFIADYQGPPAAGKGADPYQTPTPIGWQPEWNGQLPAAGPGAAAAIVDKLLPYLATTTWTDLPGAKENHPINHVPWYLAFAFCAYDGGWLPSEAEWEFAASGTASPKVTFPWGDVEPTTEHAVFELSCPPTSCATKDAFRPVGSATRGLGPFGHYDLAGNVSEWTMDYYDETYYQQFTTSRCEYCINSTPSLYRVTRGGHGLSKIAALRVTARAFYAPTSSSAGIGFRCARPL